MRILVAESHIGESDELIREAEDRDHVVVRCQPVDAHVTPCLPLAGEGTCPMDDGVDVVIELSDPVNVIEEAALDAVVLPMFAEAMRQHRFGDVVYVDGARENGVATTGVDA
jgi:hypothetical protein